MQKQELGEKERGRTEGKKGRDEHDAGEDADADDDVSDDGEDGADGDEHDTGDMKLADMITPNTPISLLPKV